jgi:hypothetical protein
LCVDPYASPFPNSCSRPVMAPPAVACACTRACRSYGQERCLHRWCLQDHCLQDHCLQLRCLQAGPGLWWKLRGDPLPMQWQPPPHRGRGYRSSWRYNRQSTCRGGLSTSDHILNRCHPARYRARRDTCAPSWPDRLRVDNAGRLHAMWSCSRAIMPRTVRKWALSEQ